jgi:hypothetical protein
MSIKQAIEALPCPFCGHVGLDFREGTTFRWIVAECSGCGASRGETRIQTLGEGTKDEWMADAREDAIREWNRRAALRSMPQGEPERLALTQATAPRKIWLNLFGDADTGCEPFPDDHEGVTWSDDEPGDFNVPYVRADLATQHTEAVRMSEAEIGKVIRSARHPSGAITQTDIARAVEQATADRLGVKMGDVRHADQA